MSKTKTVLIATALALGLSACSTDLSAVRSLASTQIEAWNAAGVDPIQLSPQGQTYAITACMSLTAISTVINPNAPELSSDAAGWCGVALKALGPAGEAL